MNANFKALRGGAETLSSCADFIALAVVVLTLGLNLGAGAPGPFERLLWRATGIEASSPMTGPGSAARVGTGWLAR